MKEIEVKILEIDRKVLEKKLRSFGAKKAFDGPIDVRMYDTPKGDFKRKDTVVRLRKKGAYGEFTIKTAHKRTVNAKSAQEYETRVNFAAMQKILHILGYTELWRMKKHRIEYAIGNVHFEIDKIPGIPWFLEIEAPSEKQLLRWVKELGYARKDAKNWWWHEVLAHYGRLNKKW